MHNRPCPTPPTAQPKPQVGGRARPKSTGWLCSRPAPAPFPSPVTPSPLRARPSQAQFQHGAPSPSIPRSRLPGSRFLQSLFREVRWPHPPSSAHTCGGGSAAQTLSEPRALLTRDPPSTDRSAGALPRHPKGSSLPSPGSMKSGRSGWVWTPGPQMCQEAPSPSVSPTTTSSSSPGWGGCALGRQPGGRMPEPTPSQLTWCQGWASCSHRTEPHSPAGTAPPPSLAGRGGGRL